jgi:4-amino-4-deoxy-L-arabinose transferase-like glycosyltransferase
MKRSTWIGAAVAVLAAFAVYLIVEPTLAGMRYGHGADEGFYLRYLQRVTREGLGVLPRLNEEWIADRVNWIYPPPTRVGLIAASAVFGEALGASMRTLSHFSLASTAVLVLAQYLFARRHTSELHAALLAVLTAGCALYLALSRRALSDAFTLLCQTVTLWTFLETLRNPRSRPARIAFVLAFAWTIATKEISVLLALPLFAFAAVERLRGRAEVSLVAHAASMAAAVALAVGAWILACGGFATWLRSTQIVLGSPATNEWALAYCSGPWYRYVLDEMLMSPWTTTLGLAGIATTLWRWRNGDYDALAVFLAVVYVGQIATLAPFVKNLRYVALLEMPLRLSAVALLLHPSVLGKTVVARGAAAALVGLMAASNVRDFQRCFIEGKLYDPLTVHLVRFREMSPPLKGAPRDAQAPTPEPAFDEER